MSRSASGAVAEGFGRAGVRAEYPAKAQEQTPAAVAPGVRFSARAIFLPPAFFFASDFSVFRSSSVHSRRTAFFSLAAPSIVRRAV